MDLDDLPASFWLEKPRRYAKPLTLIEIAQKIVDRCFYEYAIRSVKHYPIDFGRVGGHRMPQNKTVFSKE